MVNQSQTCGENYSQFCFNRLPCGLCRLTNTMCPMQSNMTDVSWSALGTSGESARENK